MSAETHAIPAVASADATAADGIALADVHVRYPAARTPALDGVTLEVRPGEHVGIAGRTGAGKSTLALVAGGFIPRVVRATVDGRVVVDGVDTTHADGRDLLGRVGIVFATPANQLSASKLSVREELAFGLENLGVPRAEMDARIEGVLARLGIGHLADREPFSLSGGEQQRVAIASIVTMGTRVLVLDEPTAQLDPAGTAEVADLLDELAREGVAILCAEHDPAVLGRTDRTIVLDQGRVAASDLPGRALGAAVLDPIGLRAPTLVRLAELAGLPPERAFDEAAIASALAARERTPPTAADLPPVPGGLPTPAGPTTPWTPVVERPPTSLEVEAVVHRYAGGIEALRGVSLRVEPGESVAIVGQNGSGKTTLVKHLNGLLRPASGRVLLGDAGTADVPVHRLAATVGFVFQNPDDQLFERSVEREVAFGPRTMGFRDDDTRRLVDAAIAAVGLEDARSTNPYDLDLSRRKLVGLASVLAIEPAIIVLDEPTTGQDGPGVARVGAIVEGLNGAGRTVIAITHDMEFAARHFSRIVVMRRGEVVTDGPPAVIFGAANVELLASTGLTPPPAARIAARLGLDAVPAGADELLRMLGG